MVRDLPTVTKPDGTLFTLLPLGTIEGELDKVLTGEEAVWVRLAAGLKPEDIMGAEVFVRVRG